ncbi:uncharacterized protein LOC119294626 isoform X2 [Triticum dicoccoides]|nr:uncharacterized protein LOC119294626 isoform X2 [Triticum dicoccoides]
MVHVPADDIEEKKVQIRREAVKKKIKLRRKAKKRAHKDKSSASEDSPFLQGDDFYDSDYYLGSEDDVTIYVHPFEKRAREFEADFQNMAMKIHWFPTSVGVAKQYVKPMVVAIGPYHRNLEHLQEMDQLKDCAVYHFILDSRHSLRDIYQAVFTVAGTARNLYSEEGPKMDDSAFVNMLVRDACFLLQYIRVHTTPHEMDASFACCLIAQQACINIDIMLLENQLPWLVVKTLMSFMPVAVEEFCARMCGYFQIRKDLKCKPFVMDDSYGPPHLLAILRSCAIGRIHGGLPLPPVGLESMSTIPSAVELEEIGIKLKASKTAKFMDMGVMKKTLCSKLYLPPLSLDKTRACWLANMVAFEVCTSSFRIEDENIAVSSYLCVLAMLMSREEDVQELRKKRLLQGELSNRETLEFFKSLTMYLYGGPLYYHIMADIESYKVNRWMWIKVHEFVYKNIKTIIAVFSVVGVLAGIFKTLMSLHLH